MESKKGKRLGDMTVLELVEFCQGRSCTNCPMRKGIRCRVGSPAGWTEDLLEAGPGEARPEKPEETDAGTYYMRRIRQDGLAAVATVVEKMRDLLGGGESGRLTVRYNGFLDRVDIKVEYGEE